MIVIRTNHDGGTHYLYNACEPIICEAKNNGFDVVVIEGDEINLKNLKKRIAKNDNDLIMYNGHGSDSAISDNNNNHFITLQHSYIFKDSVTYTRACDCINRLGKDAVKNGCRAFIGYNKSFWLPKLDGYMSRPLADPVAKPVLKSSNMIVSSLLRGKTVAESVTKSREESSKHILDLIYSNDPYKEASIPALVNNAMALEFLGEGSSKIL